MQERTVTLLAQVPSIHERLAGLRGIDRADDSPGATRFVLLALAALLLVGAFIAARRRQQRLADLRGTGAVGPVSLAGTPVTLSWRSDTARRTASGRIVSESRSLLRVRLEAADDGIPALRPGEEARIFASDTGGPITILQVVLAKPGDDGARCDDADLRFTVRERTRTLDMRQNRRVPVTLPGEVRQAGGEDDGGAGPPRPVRLSNLSTEGAEIRMAGDPPVLGDRLRLRFDLSEDGGIPLAVLARVAWSRADSPVTSRAGLAFLGQDDRQRFLIAEHLDGIAAGPETRPAAAGPALR